MAPDFSLLRFGLGMLIPASIHFNFNLIYKLFPFNSYFSFWGKSRICKEPSLNWGSNVLSKNPHKMSLLIWRLHSTQVHCWSQPHEIISVHKDIIMSPLIDKQVTPNLIAYDWMLTGQILYMDDIQMNF